MAAVEVRRRRFHRQVDEAELFVDADLRPDAGVAVDRPRVVLPGVVAELAGTRNRVERPEQLAGAHVERAHQALGVVVRRRRSRPRGTPSRRSPRLCATAGVEWTPISPVSRSIGWPLPLTTPLFRSTMPLVPNELISCAGLRVERDEPIAGRDVDDALVALAVGPVRDAAARELPRRRPRRACPRAGCASRSARRSSRRARSPTAACPPVV